MNDDDWARLDGQVDWALVKSLHYAAGVPEWAPYGPGVLDSPHLFVWVDDYGHLRDAIVGDATEARREQLLNMAQQVVEGTNERRPGSGPIDLGTPSALIELTRSGCGHGTLERDALAPLSVLLGRAMELLSEGT